jgi:hypothetical protein
MEQRGDLMGALLAALLVRHLIRGQDLDGRLGFSPVHLCGQLGQIAQKAFRGLQAATPWSAPSTTYLPACNSSPATPRKAIRRPGDAPVSCNN